MSSCNLSQSVKNISYNTIINLEKNKINDNMVIYYISGGKLGDFIFQLSAIKYNYDRFGKKGVLYIANIGDIFTFGIEKTYNDTKDLILNQPYIMDYKIYNNEKYNIDLSKWRTMLTYNNELNWKQLYKKVYDINWAEHKWLYNIDKDDNLKNTILITHSQMRYNDNIDFDIINELIDNKQTICFVCYDINEYNNFTTRYKVNIPLIKCIDFKDFVVKINSCKLLIANLSTPAAIRLSLDKNCIAILPTHPQHYNYDVKLNTNLNIISYKIVNNNIELREAIINFENI
jgi:hypothetical protein